MRQTRSYQIAKSATAPAVFFWIVQVVLGIPSVIFSATLLLSGRVDGVINVIAFFLAWIGATLAVGVASLIHARSSLILPAVFPIEVHRPIEVPQEYTQEFNGFPFRMLGKGKVEAFTADGPKVYRNWEAFARHVAPR